jgi:hypothetical protein
MHIIVYGEYFNIMFSTLPSIQVYIFDLKNAHEKYTDFSMNLKLKGVKVVDWMRCRKAIVL